MASAAEQPNQSWSYDRVAGATMKTIFPIRVIKPNVEARIGWNGDKGVYFFEARTRQGETWVGVTYEDKSIRAVVEFAEEYGPVDDETFKQLFWAGE